MKMTEIGEEEFPGSLEEFEVFRDWLEILTRAHVSYLLGGAFAVYLHTGIWRDTKDLDAFLEVKDLKRALDAFSAAGYKIEIHSPHWLAKVFHGPYFSDLIFGFWNGRLKSIRNWLDRSKAAQFGDMTVPLMALEDLIFSKIYVAGRDRFDGGDIVHLIRQSEGNVDWKLVLGQLGDDYALLLWHLILCDYIYPGHLGKEERELIVRLFEKVRGNWPKAESNSYFRGPLIDPFSFKIDVEEMGYCDPRDMTPLVDREGNLL